MVKCKEKYNRKRPITIPSTSIRICFFENTNNFKITSRYCNEIFLTVDRDPTFSVFAQKRAS